MPQESSILKRLERGDQQEDRSYYAGVDKMGEDFFFWLEGIDYKQRLPICSHDDGTKLLREKHKNNETFYGRKFSAYQLDGIDKEDEIGKAITNGTFDHGIHRPRQDQAKLVRETLESKKELFLKASKAILKCKRFQTSSLYGFSGARFQNLHDKEQPEYTRFVIRAALLMGYSAPPSEGWLVI